MSASGDVLRIKLGHCQLKCVSVKGWNGHWVNKHLILGCVEVLWGEERLCEDSASGCFWKVVVRIQMCRTLWFFFDLPKIFLSHFAITWLIGMSETIRLFKLNGLHYRTIITFCRGLSTLSCSVTSRSIGGQVSQVFLCSNLPCKKIYTNWSHQLFEISALLIFAV